MYAAEVLSKVVTDCYEVMVSDGNTLALQRISTGILTDILVLKYASIAGWRLAVAGCWLPALANTLIHKIIHICHIMSDNARQCQMRFLKGGSQVPFILYVCCLCLMTLETLALLCLGEYMLSVSRIQYNK